MPLFGIFGILELVFLGIFFILMIIGTSLDRTGVESPKWYILLIGIIALVAYTWGDFTFKGLLDSVLTLSFWAPVGIYLLVGLTYSVIEFVFEVRRRAEYFKAAWTKELDTIFSINDEKKSLRDHLFSDRDNAQHKVDSFISGQRTSFG